MESTTEPQSDSRSFRRYEILLLPKFKHHAANKFNLFILIEFEFIPSN